MLEVGIALLFRIHISSINLCYKQIWVDELHLKFNSGSDLFHPFVLIKILHVKIGGELIWFVIKFNVFFYVYYVTQELTRGACDGQ